MARYQSRKEAAIARMKYRRGVTPEEEIKAGNIQMRIDNDVDRARSDEVEKPTTKKEEKKKVVAKPEKKKATKPVKA